MLIDDKALTHWIDHFYGYGSWHARFWFVGYEESGGDTPGEVAAKLNYFFDRREAVTSGLCDIRDVYRYVNVERPGAAKLLNLHDYRFGADPTLLGGWKDLIAFVHGYQGKVLPNPLIYQAEAFAMPSAAVETLIPLYPLPAHSHAWYYAWLELPQFPFLKSRQAYQEYVYPGRIETILGNIRSYAPEVVVMYDMVNINLLKKSVQAFFPAANFRTVKGIERQIPQHHRADLDSTILLLTTQSPGLRHNRVETGYDWYEFGKRVRSEGLFCS